MDENKYELIGLISLLAFVAYLFHIMVGLAT